MKIVVDRVRCTGIGICESISEEYFEVNDDGSLTVRHETVADADGAIVREAVQSCPARALILEED
ncbi:ferredoxin [Nocardia sp. NPDC050378]|uniref:ferredoxin n=1 Tax=Nocardia sp. NPDC050378 TaxID=3155400 RepID=UPI0033CDAEDE